MKTGPCEFFRDFFAVSRFRSIGSGRAMPGLVSQWCQLIAAAILFPACAFAQTDLDSRIAIVERIAERLEGQLGSFGLRIPAGESEFLEMRPGMAVADGTARYGAEEEVLEREIPVLQGQRIEGTVQSEIKRTGTRTLIIRRQRVSIFLSDQWRPRVTAG